jgi:hypothetical protein
MENPEKPKMKIVHIKDDASSDSLVDQEKFEEIKRLKFLLEKAETDEEREKIDFQLRQLLLS